MVTEVKAYQAEDGQIFPTVEAAAEHDAISKLKKLGLFNHGTILAVVERAAGVVVVLWPLLDDSLRSHLVDGTELDGALSDPLKPETPTCPQ